MIEDWLMPWLVRGLRLAVVGMIVLLLVVLICDY